MKRFIGLLSFVLLGMAVSGNAEELSRERQEEIIRNYMYVTGQLDDIPEGLATAVDGHGHPVVKCGMSAVADFVMNRDRLDKDLIESMALQSQPDRPMLENEETYDSPGGIVKVHYTQTGDDAVLAGDTSPANGIPDYVEQTALIFDSVHAWIVDSLGYPPPVQDDFYPEGGDSLYDVYLLDIGSNVYGLAFLENTQVDGSNSLRATSFIQLDRNYEDLNQYASRPLDAVRVTTAHEYFHAVQFAIDYTETDIYPLGPDRTFAARYWMEMSAVWMEEQLYDGINDYYFYLPFFFDDPRSSLQRFRSFGDLHPYACGIFPMFLDETFGPDVIRDIWQRCGEGGVGAQFMPSTNTVIDSITGGSANWSTIYREFTLWAWFTGTRASLAPSGVGFSERDAFPGFPDSMIDVRSFYPAVRLGNENPFNPAHNGMSFLQMDDLYLQVPDTTYWICDSLYDSTCVDSMQVLDTTMGYDYIFVDEATGDTTFWDCFTWDDMVCGDSVQVPKDSTWDFFHPVCPRIGPCEDTTYWRCTTYVDVRCVDSTQVADELSGHDFIAVDSVLDAYIALGADRIGEYPPLPQGWGLSLIYQFQDFPDSVEIDRLTLPDQSVPRFVVPDPHQYRRIVAAFSPASPSTSDDYFRPFPLFLPMDIGYFIDSTEVDETQVDKPSVVLAPYPNPAVVSQMGGADLAFRFEAGTDSQGRPVIPENSRPYLVIDIYTIAGERVKTIARQADEVLANTYEVGWDMLNESGEEVASGAYIAYARLYPSEDNPNALAEEHVKIAIIR